MFFLVFWALAFNKPKFDKNSKIEYIDEDLRDKLHISFTEEQKKEIESKTEQHEYQAETTRLLSILIDSLYHNKDIFVRELISNANDALDKIRFEAIRDPSVLENGPKNLEVLIDINEEEKTISITDTGIGMTKNELIENLGRIARSGTLEFQKMLQAGDTNLIGQFGVGFYSAFLVADKVTVVSKSNNDTKQWIWESDASAQFTVTEDPRGVTLGRGTSIILHLKDNCYNYVDRDRIVGIIRHYSMFVDFPVKIWHFKEMYVDPDDEPEESAPEEDIEDVFGGEGVFEESSEDETAKTKKTTTSHKKKDDEKQPILKTVWQWVQVNDRKPIWLRDPNEVIESDYNEFFTIFFKEPKGPLLHTHFKAEGRVQFSALFFIPSVPPPADQLFAHTTRNARLYVKRILVADEWGDELLPDYLHFVKGVIDSNDLSLNVDRDRLVKMNALKLIKRRVTSKILSVIRNMFVNEPRLYDDFYSKYGGNIKYGIVDDPENKRMLSKLLMFYSSYSPKRLTTLDEYVQRMKKGQEKIYWIGAATLDEARNSPYTETLLEKGYEVLFAIEPIDVHCFERMEDFEGLPIENPEKGNDAPEEKLQDVRGLNFSQRRFNRLVRWFKAVVGERMETMVLSTRLKTTPAICSAASFGYTASHERLMRAQTVQDAQMADNLIMNRKVLELNYRHPTVKNLIERIVANPKDRLVQEDARLLFDAALLAGGYTLGDPLNFTKRVFRMIGTSYQIDREVDEFEDENKVFYPRVEDDFDFEARVTGKKFVKVGGKNFKIYGDDDGNGDELPADLHPPTPEENIAGLL